MVLAERGRALERRKKFAANRTKNYCRYESLGPGVGNLDGCVQFASLPAGERSDVREAGRVGGVFRRWVNM